MDHAVARCIVRFCGLTTATILLGACAAIEPPTAATRNQIIISVRDQKMTVVKADHTRVTFPISTSKFGLGDQRGTYETPTGELAVASKIGSGAPSGSVFHGRVRTGEIVKVDAPGRDAIVTRILTLRGLESNNQKAFSRGIYIHGTPEERNIGRPTSYGCIRMRSRDVIALYDMVKVGARVQIIDTTQRQAIAANILQSVPTMPTGPGGAPPATIPVPVSAGTATGAMAVADAGSTTVVRSITTTTTSTGATHTTTTSAVAANGSAPATTTTTVKVQPPFPGVGAALNKKEWNGSARKLLAQQEAADARAKQRDARPLVGAPTPTRPISNTSEDSRQSRASTPGSL